MGKITRLLFRHRVLLGIIVIASVLRLWQLGTVPPSPDWDEAALGYNAYSVLKTGRDEYGTWFPLSLRSFDDYKPPLYIYLAIPPIAIFGLHTWSVRLPAALMGIAAVVGSYFLVEEIFVEIKKRKNPLISFLPRLVALLLALSPWHIQFSRIAFEANIGVTLNIWGVYFFLRGLREKRYILLSALLFGLALYAYHSERIFVPLLLFLLGLLHRRELLKISKTVIVAGIVGCLVIGPLIPVLFNQKTLTRLRGTSSLADQTGLLARSVLRLDQDKIAGDPTGIFFDNRRIVWIRTIVNGYLSHYSFRWLFLTGDNPRHHAPDIGLLYLWELPFFLWGIFSIPRYGKRVAALLLGWFFIAPIAASPTTELPHAIRTLVFLPTFQIFTAIGVIQGTYVLKEKRQFFVRMVVSAMAIVIAWNVVYYLHMYFGHMNHDFSQYWQYGYEQAVAYTKSHRQQYNKIVVSTKLEQPHMFFLYFLQYDPRKYLEEGGTSSGGFAEYRNKFDIYEFRTIVWDKEIKDGTILYIGTPKEIPSANLSTISYLDGTEAIRIADH